MKKLPKLSIITINLNNKDGLKKTIESVTKQTYLNLEFIIVDGASKDGSKELIEKNKQKISFCISEPDTGIYNAMNKGILEAKGEYFLFLNSGDWLVSHEIIEKCINNLPSGDILSGACEISRNGKVIHTIEPERLLTFESFYKKTIPHQSTFIKRTLFERLGLYNEKYRIHGDYEFWLRAVIRNNCTYGVLPYTITNYNLEGLSGRREFQNLSKAEIESIQENYIPERILLDYEAWEKERSEMQAYHWAKSKFVMSYIVQNIYKIAKVVAKLKIKFRKPNV